MTKSSDYFPKPLQGQYLIAEITTPQFTQKFNESIYLVRFDSTKFSAYIGCNRIGGSYQLHEWSVKFGPAMSTKMYCEDKNEQETALLNCLEGVKQIIDEEGGVVRIESDSVSLKLIKLD